MKFLKTIRGRLTIYFTAILGIILCIFSIVLYYVFAHQIRDEIDKAMLMLAVSVKEEINNDGIQKDLFDEIKETYIPYSATSQQYFDILNENGTSIIDFKSDTNIDLSVKENLKKELLKGGQIFETAETINIRSNESEQSEFRILIYPLRYNSENLFLLIGIPLTNLNSTLTGFRVILFISIPFFLMLSFLSGWLFSKRAYAPVNDLIQSTRLISAGNLDKRLPVAKSGDEIEDLAETLNGMISRLQKSFESLKQFTSDASHELRTPLTILKGEIEVALLKQRTEEEYERILRNSLEETERLHKIVEGLLTLSQAESGKALINSENIFLKEILTDAVSKIKILAEKKNIRIILKLEDGTAGTWDKLIKGDRNLLLNVFINLLDNSIKYSPPNSEVICEEKTDPEKKEIHVSVTDSGSGISSENPESVFDRFTRSDLSRTRKDNSGAGLGLAIAKAVIESHNGRISVKSIPGKGSTFTVTLPYLT